ncbi:SDR family oxidoreductase [Mucilaginibacter roseus]|uniref:SDR family oxidoreductase n=1 Tax=Mucilaginibacter roseus TaxID=1528868 RepID=A0ABS8TVQ7_9SPHI|nr:SDR family oxidoreductase [Mucilaginibacter roseus]MCD8738971.1 SDR family oxidoreductase [Mucilaginibacter roseus]
MEAEDTISILGCGWYGLALAKQLVQSGYAVKGSTTTSEKLTLLSKYGIESFLIDAADEQNALNPLFFESKILVIAIPPKVRSGNGENYIPQIKNIVKAAKASDTIEHVIYISSTSVYGDNNSVVTETVSPQPSTESGNVLLAVENLLRAEPAFTTTIIRFGGLFGPGRDAGRFFAGKSNIPNGQAPVNMIHLDDCLGITSAILEKRAFGHTYNACTPEHPPKTQFYAKAAEQSNLTAPEFIDELNEWKEVNSINVPKLLNYHFKHKLI